MRSNRLKYKIGDRIHNWVIKDHAQINKWKQSCVLVECDCGNVATRVLNQLIRQKAISCIKCVYCAMPKTKVGEIYGELRVVQTRPGLQRTKNTFVQCSCGSDPFWVRFSSMASGNTKSCGCLHKKAVSEIKRHKVKQKVRKKTIVRTTTGQLKMREMMVDGLNTGCRQDRVLCSRYRTCGDQLFQFDCPGFSRFKRLY